MSPPQEKSLRIGAAGAGRGLSDLHSCARRAAVPQSGQKAWPQAPGGSRAGALEGPILHLHPQGRGRRFLPCALTSLSQAPGPQVGVGQVSASFPSPGHQSHARPGTGWSQWVPGRAARPWAPPQPALPRWTEPSQACRGCVRRGTGWCTGPGSRALGGGRRPGLGPGPSPPLSGPESLFLQLPAKPHGKRPLGLSKAPGAPPGAPALPTARPGGASAGLGAGSRPCGAVPRIYLCSRQLIISTGRGHPR